MKNISRFDIAMIIAFVVVALAGAGVWYYLSGLLQNAQDDVGTANDAFKKYSSQQAYLPTATNVKILKDNIALMQAQLDPLVRTKFQSDGNKLSSVTTGEDTVAWKRDLDEKMRALNSAAKIHGIGAPPNFYFSFSRYLNQNPAEEKTAVLTKQLLAVDEIATILINAPVKNIGTFRRTFEEDAQPPTTNGAESLAGHATESAGHTYIAYPFQVDFDTGIDGFRKVVNDLTQSPYFFVIRSLNVQNSNPRSPVLATLDQIAGTPTTSILDSPGEAAAVKSTVGPQYLFGSETIHVIARIDMIEWTSEVSQRVPVKAPPPVVPAHSQIQPVGVN